MTPKKNTFSRPLFARIFLGMSAKPMAAGQAEHRRELLAGLSGRVIEVGAGHGLNFPFYPDSVSEVLAVEPENRLRALATEAVKSASVAIRVVPGLADRLPAKDGEFDAGVACQVLCSVPSQAQALAELYRVIRPGGELRFYEHVRSKNPLLGAGQRIIDIGWSRIGGGCHTSRDTEAAIKEAGFELERHKRFPFRPSLLDSVAASHILGIARRPA